MVEIPFEKVSLLGFTPSIIISTCATIIASQALIMEALISEAMNLNFWPNYS
jgi:KUP system potassium uptake protein